MDNKRTFSSTSLDDPRAGRFLKPRDSSDLADRMRPLELSDLLGPTRPRVERTASRPNRKSRSLREQASLRRREHTNANADFDLRSHFAMKVNTVDEFRDAFSIVGISGSVSTPERTCEVETSGVREIISDSIRLAKAKVKPDFFDEEFEPAVNHVTAHLVAAKLNYAHLGAATGSTRSEEIPATVQTLEHVRMSSTTTFIGVAGYLDSIGKFTIDGVRVTPYLRRLMHDDNKASFQPGDCIYHHTPQIYSEIFRRQFAEPGLTTDQQRTLLANLGISVPDAGSNFIPPGRDLVKDLAVVRLHMERLSQKYPRCVKSVDVSTGNGSSSQLVAYTPPDGFEPVRVWSPLNLEAMDLYVGAAFRFCVDRPPLPLPPELHPRLIARQIHTTLDGAVSNWLNNLMSRG